MRLAATRAAVLAAMRAGGSLAPARCRATKPDTITTPIAWIDTVSLGGPVKTLDGRVSITATVIVVTDGTNDAATNALDDYTDEIAAQLVEAGLDELGGDLVGVVVEGVGGGVVGSVSDDDDGGRDADSAVERLDRAAERDGVDPGDGCGDRVGFGGPTAGRGEGASGPHGGQDSGSGSGESHRGQIPRPMPRRAKSLMSGHTRAIGSRPRRTGPRSVNSSSTPPGAPGAR